MRILFVCLGNICRSPLAEGAFEKALARAGETAAHTAASAGTGSWHVGDAPDRRAQMAAKARGFDISAQRARQVSADDFAAYDLILAMDAANLADLCALAGAGSADKVHLFLDYADGVETQDVPDPFYGGPDHFEAALDLIETGAAGLVARLARDRN